MNGFWRHTALICTSVILIQSCNSYKKELHDEKSERLYQQLSPERSGIVFSNKLTETNEANYFFYPDFYGGGGVAIGDINNDGLPDIYFTSVMVHNELYLNKGNLQFENITVSAGVNASGKWTKGVTMADVNADGYLDIYVSIAGPLPDRKNLLFINNGNNTFTEKAKSFGIADEGYSVQSAFFDFDRDGDLDLYVGCNPPTPFQSSNSFFAGKVKNPGPYETDRMYRNEGNDHFKDVTEEAGITNFGLTLGISIADLNNDGWPDVYVSNDFNSPDYLYINNGDGTFSDKIDDYLMHTVQFGMGTDAGDINNDGWVDLMQLDMAYSSNWKKKTNMHIVHPDQFYEMIELGLHRQYMRNCLQLNTGLGAFSDIAEIAGVHSTDWSWGALFVDMNNDGFKDLYFTNGMRRDVNDIDFLDYVKSRVAAKNLDMKKSLEILKKIPVNPVENFAFLNKGDLTFDHKVGNYGLGFRGFSNGISYADLDRDGDLDIVVNNLDSKSLVFENLTDTATGKFIRFKLDGNKNNRNAIGAKITIYHGKTLQYQELMPTRGYLSSVEPVVHFGLGKISKVDSALIIWPNGGFQKLYNLQVNQVNEIAQKVDSAFQYPVEKRNETIFACLELKLSPPYRHQENDFNDFKRELLLPHKMSQFGPALAVADVNSDGLEDFFVGGALGFPGAMYLQEKDGTFTVVQEKLWTVDKDYEDVSALFFDANNDGSPDLYVVSGGNERPAGDPFYQDRIYQNNGKGGFIKGLNALPHLYESGSRVKSADFDNDGDLDLFVGGRQVPGKYPMPANSYILRNISSKENVKFEDVTKNVAPMLNGIGMVTDAAWKDFNSDGWMDIAVVGEWMSIVLLQNNQGKLIDVSEQFGPEDQTGWWFSLAFADIDMDGDQDLIAGNLGLNYRYKASPGEPFEIYFGDLDGNGQQDIVLGYYNEHELYPFSNINNSILQIPSLKGKFKTNRDFANANLMEVYGQSTLANALHYEAKTFATTFFENRGDSLVPNVMGNYAQLSAINAIITDDFNGDLKPDLFLAGNLLESEVETPRSDAGYGLFMLGDGKGHFKTLTPLESGILLKGEVREMATIKLFDGTKGILIARNEDSLVLIKIESLSKTRMVENLIVNK